MTEHRPRILLIDDDRSFLRKASRFLWLSGFEATTCSDPVRALETWRDGGFQIAVTDVSMPRMNGIEVLRALRLQDSGARVIVLTGRNEEELRRLALAEGAAVFLTKPLDLERFIEVLSEVLDPAGGGKSRNGVAAPGNLNHASGGKGELM